MTAAMFITGIRTTALSLPFRQPYHWAGRVDHGAAVVLVEVETDAGITGVGESTAPLAAEGTLAALAAVTPLFVGEPAHDVDRLVTRARFLGGFNWTPWHANLVLAGLEMALWDAIGKAAGQPVHRLLGGRVHDSVDYFGFPQGDAADELAADAARLAEAGEFLIPKSEGLIGDDHVVAEIGEVLTGAAPGRTSPDEITLFKSLGIAVEDLAAAHAVYEAAKERELGTWVEIGGLHFGKAVEG